MSAESWPAENGTVSEPGDATRAIPSLRGQAVTSTAVDADTTAADKSKLPMAVAVLLVLFLGGVYAATLHPGVGRGDAAELQYAAALLGVCHPPGYAIEVTFGKLFSKLPLGSTIAWRTNLMMAVCAVVGCLALYGVVHRITRQIVPAAGAAMILGFSSVYWTHSVLAEVYVFYAMFLLLAIYTATRFVLGDQARWLYLTALFLGICVGDRISEALILPAFLVLWLAHRKQARLTVGRLAVSLALFLVPFSYSVTFFMLRFQPDQPYARDDFACQRVMGEPLPSPNSGTAAHLKYAVRYCLGLEWAERMPHSSDRLWWDVDKYAWMLSGLGGLGNRFDTQDPLTRAKQFQQGSGTSVGAVGVVLGLLGIWFGARQRWRWILFAFALFAGNAAFYVGYQAFDNLDFTIPGIVGLSLLGGLGMAVRPPLPSVRSGRRAWQLACLLAPLFLLVTNYRFMDRRTDEQRARADYCTHLASAPLPAGSAIISQRNSGMVYRYLFHVEANRRDVSVINAAPPDWSLLIEHLSQAGRPVFVRTTPGNRPQFGPSRMPGDVIRADLRARWYPRTPPELAKFDFLAATIR